MMFFKLFNPQNTLKYVKLETLFWRKIVTFPTLIFIIWNFNNSSIFLFLSVLVVNSCQIVFPSSVLENVLPLPQLKKKKITVTSFKSSKWALESSSKYRLSYPILQECESTLAKAFQAAMETTFFFHYDSTPGWELLECKPPIQAHWQLVEWTDEAWKIF